MRALLIGNTGQLGWELERAPLPPCELTAVDYPQIDLLDPDSIRHWIGEIQPDLILNAAAYTAVDQAEAEPDMAQAINGVAPGVLAELAKPLDAILIHFSTDFVFDGRKGEPYREEDPPLPVNTYGRTKLAGEKAALQVGGQVFIFRTSWLYSMRKESFLTKVLRWSRSQEELRIVSDQTGSPTWARTLAEVTARSVSVLCDQSRDWRMEQAGIYHTAGIGAATRFEWAEKILALDPKHEEQVTHTLSKACSSDFDTPAQRPEYSALDCGKFQGVFDLFYTPWQASLEAALSV